MLPFVKVIPSEGMPSLGNPFVKGNLFVLFCVIFPKDRELSAEQIATLRNVLSDTQSDSDIKGAADVMTDDEEGPFIEEANMINGDLRQFGKGGANHSGGDDALDSDDEEGGAGVREVQCQQL